MGVQGSCLWAYAITSNLVAIIFVSLYLTCGNEQDIVTGNEQKIVKYDILTLDQSETANESEGYSYLSFTILELIVITLIGLGPIILLIKLLMKGKKKYIKRKEKLAAEMAKREQKQQQDIRDRIMLEMAVTSGISRSTILSANSGEETADSVQVEILPGPIKQDTVKFP